MRADRAVAVLERLDSMASDGQPIETAERPRRGTVVITQASSMKPQPVAFEWEGWIARGKLQILAGALGVGKSTIATAIAATISCAGRWPDGTWCSGPGQVLIWSGEDSPEDTLLPRLIANGADTSRISFITGVRVDPDDEIEAFDPARDMGALVEAASDFEDVRLVIIDPLVSAVAGDSHKNAETRRALAPVVNFAEATGAAILGIAHFNKSGSGDPLGRVNGSLAFGALARIVIGAAKVRTGDGERRVLARIKSNVGPDAGGFEYTLTQARIEDGIDASRVRWGAALEGDARDL